MKLYFLFIALLICTSAIAQQHFFLYIQTENKQPFYIKMNNKVYSSSATGYVVVPKLVPDTYQMTVGFNKDAYPEQQFRCIVDKDAGYLLKNYGEKGWGFLNLQNGEIVMSGGVKKPGDNDDDAFTKTLSQVVNTPDLKGEEKKEVEKEPQPEVKIIEVPVKETTVSSISLLLNNKDNSGRQMVYLDGKDTIRLFIPSTGGGPYPTGPDPVFTELKANKKEEKAEEKTVVKEAIAEPPVVKEPIKEAIKKDTTIAEKTDVAQTGNKVNADNHSSPAVNCALFASNDEFLKLRKKMAAEKNDEAMIGTARKQFKSRCFATEQIKNLSVLFLSDEGRYKFLDAAYPYVHDVEHFPGLESILTDNYYRNRFKAMLHH